jgi:hypothetical protein
MIYEYIKDNGSFEHYYQHENSNLKAITANSISQIF